MASEVYFANTAGYDVAILSVTFTNAAGTPTDPTVVQCVITDPTETAVTHTYLGAAPADITRVSAGVYSLSVPTTLIGLWGYDWQASGVVQEENAGTFTVNPAGQINQFYTSVEELADRLGGIANPNQNLQLQKAVQGAFTAINRHCGRHFYQVTETRTFVPYSIWEQPIDDLVSISQLNIDTTGSGVFDQSWVNGTDYELAIDPLEFNLRAAGEPVPYGLALVINAMSGGKFFPFIWPFSKRDRVQIVGTWGWPQVPYAIEQASMQVATEFYQLKNAPFGLAGTSEFGLVRIPKTNPYVMPLLAPYRHPRRKVGV